MELSVKVKSVKVSVKVKVIHRLQWYVTLLATVFTPVIHLY